MRKMRSLTFIPHHSNKQITKHKPFKISVSTLALYPETYSQPDIFFGSEFWWGTKIKKRERKTKLKAKNMKIIFQKSHIYKKSQLKQTDRHHQTTTAQHPKGTVPNTKKNQKEVLLLKDIRQTDEWFGRTSLFHEWQNVFELSSSWFSGDTIQWVMKPFSLLSDREEADVYNELHMDIHHDHDRWNLFFRSVQWFVCGSLLVGNLKSFS